MRLKSIALSLSLSPYHCPDKSEILLKMVTSHSSIIVSRFPQTLCSFKVLNHFSIFNFSVGIAFREFPEKLEKFIPKLVNCFQLVRVEALLRINKKDTPVHSSGTKLSTSLLF